LSEEVNKILPSKYEGKWHARRGSLSESKVEGGERAPMSSAFQIIQENIFVVESWLKIKSVSFANCEELR